jgi:hypothetical protein
LLNARKRALLSDLGFAKHIVNKDGFTLIGGTEGTPV